MEILETVTYKSQEQVNELVEAYNLRRVENTLSEQVYEAHENTIYEGLVMTVRDRDIVFTRKEY